VKRLAPPTDLASSPRWSPGGKWIAFIGAAGGIAKLHVGSAEGEEVINLTERRENESSPAWRPRPSKTPDPTARTIR
jgi:Tol biopolymer transport system component